MKICSKQKLGGVDYVDEGYDADKYMALWARIVDCHSVDYWSVNDWWNDYNESDPVKRNNLYLNIFQKATKHYSFFGNKLFLFTKIFKLYFWND